MGFWNKVAPFGPEQWLANKVVGPKAEVSGKLDDRRVSQVEWDPDTGMPIGLVGPPSKRRALAYQQHANELVALRNSRTRADARNFMAQGLRSSETFRSGGYASMASGLWGQRAQLAFNDIREAPDLMAGYREQSMVDAQNAQRRAAKRQFYGTLIQTAATVVGGVFGGPAGAAAGSQLGGNIKQGISGYQVGQDSGNFSPYGANGGMAPVSNAGANAAMANYSYGDGSFDNRWSSANKARMDKIAPVSAGPINPSNNGTGGWA